MKVIHQYRADMVIDPEINWKALNVGGPRCAIQCPYATSREPTVLREQTNAAGSGADDLLLESLRLVEKDGLNG